MRSSDWSSDVFSYDLRHIDAVRRRRNGDDEHHQHHQHDVDQRRRVDVRIDIGISTKNAAMEHAAFAHRLLLPVGERNDAIDGRPARFKGLRSYRAHWVIAYHYSQTASKIATDIDRLRTVARVPKKGGP